MSDWIRIRGARQHNLKGCDVDIPRSRLTAVSGVSGSGKSSLVFDTLYAEGQRCYVESLSTYARQFLERLPKPDVDWIDGISPAIAIQQRNAVRSGRSTVGTVTEISDYLRVLFARAGRIVCPGCGQQVLTETPESVWRQARKLWDDAALLLVGYPLTVSDAGALNGWAEPLLAQGFQRAVVGQSVIRLDESGLADSPTPAGGETITVVADRLKLVAKARSRFVEAVELCFQQADGRVVLCDRDLTQRHEFSTALRCESCDRTFLPPTAQLFSFNSPQGACRACHGFGNRMEFAEEKIVPDSTLSLHDGALKPWSSETFVHLLPALYSFCRRNQIPIEVPFGQLPRKLQRLVLEGKDHGYTGVIPFLEEMRRKMERSHHRFFTRRFMGDTTCRACGGSRLRPEALAVKVGSFDLGQVGMLSISAALVKLQKLHLNKTNLATAGEILDEVVHRLRFLENVGLGYLTLDRLTRTLSGGEAQRIHLANALGSRLVDTLYVLDEPTTGLHADDIERLVAVLQELVAAGNSVVVVEHDLSVLSAAEYFIELGPGAGQRGGEVVYQGSLDALLAHGETLTAAYLRGEKSLPKPRRRRDGQPPILRIRGARKNNLRNLDVRIPLQRFVCLTGISGSGKSSLLNGCLFDGLTMRATGGEGRSFPFTSIHGAVSVDKVVRVDQSPIGKSSRSNPATYLQVLGSIRELFAATSESLARGYPAGRFSFNTAGGRCPECQGLGEHRVEMHFMADISVPCEECGGSRFNPATLEVRYRGRNIAEVLGLTVDEALRFFSSHTSVTQRLWLLKKVGLGYLRLGQAATTLSGGESQRLKIARELAVPSGRHNLYLLDEPTTGLHVDDVGALVKVLHELVEQKHSVLVIEHNLDLIAQADWIIDLGPGGGENGGRIVAQGTPEAITAESDSLTGRYLSSRLARPQRAKETD
ncbi:MAG: excinuclease ABC subunit UvrA [bacterium]